MLFVSMVSAGLHAQSPYFETIGGTEVELLAFLQNQEGSIVVEQEGDRIEVSADSTFIVYILRKGKVISIDFKRHFHSRQEAVAAYNRSLNFLYKRGVPMRQVKNLDSCRMIRGYGNGIEADLTIMPTNNTYLLNADLAVINR